MAGWGKDGYFYNDNNELRRADNKWLQQQEQNKLLDEQNKLQKQQAEAMKEQTELLKQQQQQQLRLQEDQLIREIEKERQERINQKEKETRDEIQEFISDFFRERDKKIFPIIEESGIKKPKEYYDKLYELYNSKLQENELQLLSDNNLMFIKNKIDKYPEEIQNKINSVNNMKIKTVSDVTKTMIKIYIVMGLITGIISYIASQEIWLPLIMFGIILFTAIPMILSTRKNTKKEFQKQIKQKRESIELINIEIEKYNESIKSNKDKWENKIRNFEKKRLENFNYELEFALYELTKMEKQLQDKIEVKTKEFCDFIGSNYIKQYPVSYTFKFNSYPEDFEEKRKAYWKEKNMKNAQEMGTEIFEELNDEIYDNNNNNTEYEEISEESENDIVNIMLYNAGIDKIKVISVIRTITGISLKEAKIIVDAPPSIIKQNITREDAKEIKSEFEKIGATVEIVKV